MSKLIAITLLSAAAACGGGGESSSGPLSKHFDDMYIARVPVEQQRAAVETSQNAYQVAKMENANAEAADQEAKSQLSVVKNDEKASKLAVDSALSNKKSAESSQDSNRINNAARELHAAEASNKAAKARVKYFEAYASWTHKQHRATQDNMYWREAQFELAKSQLAQKNNVQPKGVQYDWFPKQEAERGKTAASSKSKADDEKKKALAQRDSWLKQQADSDKENSRSSSFPDPMGGGGTAAAGGVSSPAATP